MKTESFALSIHDFAVLLILRWRHECSFMGFGVEPLRLALDWFGGVESFETVFLESSKEHPFSHFQTRIELNKLFISLNICQFVGRNSKKGTVKVIYGIKKIACEALNAELLCSIDVSLSALLKVLELSDGAKISVLFFVC